MSKIAGKSHARRGRAPLPPEKGKRYPLNMRTTKEMRETVKAAADRSGRSMVQEVEFLVEQALRDEEARAGSFGGRHTYALMRVVGSAIAAAEVIKGTTWAADLDLFREVRSIVLTILTAFEISIRESSVRPEHGQAPGPEDVLAALSGRGGKAQGDDPLIPLAEAIRESLLEVGAERRRAGARAKAPPATPHKRVMGPPLGEIRRDMDLSTEPPASAPGAAGPVGASTGTGPTVSPSSPPPDHPGEEGDES